MGKADAAWLTRGYWITKTPSRQGAKARRCREKSTQPRRREPARVLSLPIAAALVSPNGHMRIRRQPNFVDRSFIDFPNWKGTTMRIFTASVIIAAVALGTPAFVQAQGAPPQPEAPPAQSSTVIRSIQ